MGLRVFCQRTTSVTSSVKHQQRILEAMSAVEEEIKPTTPAGSGVKAVKALKEDKSDEKNDDPMNITATTVASDEEAKAKAEEKKEDAPAEKKEEAAPAPAEEKKEAAPEALDKEA